MSAPDTLNALAERAIALARPGARAILGITGSPGAGKTTLAESLTARVNEKVGANRGFAANLSMDGYHLANATLDRLGIHDRKGASDTFDGWGFVSLLQRLRVELDHTVYAPGFDRNVDEGVAGQVAVAPATQLVVVEGNYLLVDAEPWSQVKGLLSEAWFCETSPGERMARLVDRHERHGRSPAAARQWAQAVDGKNAVLIDATKGRADLIVSGSTGSVN